MCSPAVYLHLHLIAPPLFPQDVFSKHVGMFLHGVKPRAYKCLRTLRSGETDSLKPFSNNKNKKTNYNFLFSVWTFQNSDLDSLPALGPESYKMQTLSLNDEALSTQVDYRECSVNSQQRHNNI